MTPIEMVGGLLLAAFSGGVVVRLLDRIWSVKDQAKKETVAEKELHINESDRIRDELRKAEADLREELRRVERDEASWRTKYWEAIGSRQMLETELHTMRPRFIDLIQQNQHLIAENETLKLRAGRRVSDKQTETLYRIEQAGQLAADKAQGVADDLANSHARADATEGPHGAAADAASKTDKSEQDDERREP